MNADLTIDVLVPSAPVLPCLPVSEPRVRAQQIKSIAHSHAMDVSEQAPRDPSPFCHGKMLGDSFPPVCRNKQQQFYITGNHSINEYASSHRLHLAV